MKWSLKEEVVILAAVAICSLFLFVSSLTFVPIDYSANTASLEAGGCALTFTYDIDRDAIVEIWQEFPDKNVNVYSQVIEDTGSFVYLVEGFSGTVTYKIYSEEVGPGSPLEPYVLFRQVDCE